MIKEATGFKTSVNIKFDLGKSEFVDRYLPTPSHAESLLGLLRGFTGTDNNRRKSHIIIGPYGTGKSLIATIIGNLTSKSLDDPTLETLISKFDKVHEDIYVELQQVRNLEEKYLPVVLNGNEGRFRQALLNAVVRTLNENRIDIVLPGQYGKILETVDLWEREYPKTFKEFKRLLKMSEKDIELWRIAVMNQEKKDLDWFISVYPLLTSGARFVAEYNEGFIDQIKQVLEQLSKKNIGLFIAYDEFGRLLQTLEPHEMHETMQDLQDLAELTDHYGDNLHLLLITHRNLRQYFGFMHEDFRNEFQRIEKRFKVYYVESDKATFIRLADNIIQGFRENIGPIQETKNQVLEYLRKYPLFPELNQQEIEKIIVTGIYPVHPVALYLLPYLSSNFGQNERTLFTFLESNETGGLRNHLGKSMDYYLGSDLFTYFFPNIHDIDTSEEEFAVLRVYKTLLKKHTQLMEDPRKLNMIRLIALWQLAGLQSRIKLDTEFLCFAMNLSTNEIASLLKDLSFSKAIRYNRVLGYWELLEGSSFHIEQLIMDKLPYAATSRPKRLVVLDSCLPKRYYLANEYNDQKSMTRYAEVKFIFSTDIVQEQVDLNELETESSADVVLYYVLLDNMADLPTVIEKLKQVKNDSSLFCISKWPFVTIEEQLIEYSAIETLLVDTELLQQDKNLMQELILRKADLHFIIQDFLSKFTSYGKDVEWIYNGEVTEIKSEIMLENLLSKLMMEIYPNTPEVRNDSFNRRRLNNVQRKAGYIVLDHVINHYGESDLGIEGQGPDYLIYATVFKNNQLDITDLDNISSLEFKELRKVLLTHLTENTIGTLQDFVDIMQSAPFGIREPLVPLYFVALLRDKWDQIMFYYDELFVAGINGEKLYTMFGEANEYKYVYHNFDEKYQTFFTLLEEQFGAYENELVMNKPIIIRLNNALLTWLRNLPRITQITNNIDEELVWLKDTIRRSEINPQEALTKLFEVYENNLDNLVLQKQYLEGYFSIYKQELEQEIFDITGQESFEELRNWADRQEPHVQKQNNFVKCILKCTASNLWLEEFSYQFIGIEMENWSDTTGELFENQLRVDYDTIYRMEPIEGEHIHLEYNGKTKMVNKVTLSTKSDTIYKNVERMIKNAGRNITKDEIEYLVLKLVDEFIE